MGRVTVFFIILIGFTFQTQAQSTSASSQRGIFSWSVGYEYAQTRLLNTDSTFASFTGSGFRSELDVSLTPNGPGNFRLFGAASLTNLTGEQTSSDEIENREAIVGAKIFATNWLYGGAAYGRITQVIDAEGTSVTVTNPVSTGGIGMEFHLAGSWYLNLSVWYFQVLIKKNADLESTSYAEGINGYLSVTWSPPSTIVTQVFK